MSNFLEIKAQITEMQNGIDFLIKNQNTCNAWVGCNVNLDLLKEVQSLKEKLTKIEEMAGGNQAKFREHFTSDLTIGEIFEKRDTPSVKKIRI